MSATSKFLKIISAAKVSFEMLDELNRAVGEHVEQVEERGPGDALWVLLRVFGQRLDPHTLTAIIFRMEALAVLIQSGQINEWQLPDKSPRGAVLVHEALLKAAAEATLILSNRRGVQPRFDMAEFRHIALLAAVPEGRA